MEKEAATIPQRKPTGGSAKSMAKSVEERGSIALEVGICEPHQRPFEAMCNQCKMYCSLKIFL